MKKIMILAGLTLSVAAAACSGGGGGGGTAYPFTSGTYVTSNAAIPEDGCQTGDTPADYNGELSDVVVNGSTVIVDSSLTLTRSGNNVTGSVTEQVDLNQFGVDCIVDVQANIHAVVTGTDQASVSNSTNITENSGTQCNAQGIPPLPCTTRVTFDLNKQ